MAAAALAALGAMTGGCVTARGPAARLAEADGIEITGATGVDKDLIARNVRIIGSGEHGIDLSDVQELYLSMGYPEAKLEVRFVGERARGKREIHVTEGRFARVGHVSLEVDALPEASAWIPFLPLRAGGPFSPRAYEESYGRLVAALRGAGFARAEVTRGAFLDPETFEVRVSFLVAAGPRGERYRFGSAFVLGARRSSSEHVRGQVLRFVVPGEPFELARLEAAREHLLASGEYTSVKVSLGAVEDDRRLIAIVVQVEEAPEARSGRSWTDAVPFVLIPVSR